MRRTTLLPCNYQPPEGFANLYLVREELRGGVWEPVAYGVAAGVLDKDGQPGFLHPFEERRDGGCPLCFVNLAILWKEDTDLAAMGGRFS